MTAAPLPTKEEIALLPPFEALPADRIHLVATDAQAAAALAVLSQATVLGFDTESRPTFVRDQVSDGPHLVQFATTEGAWLFQLRTPGCRQAVAALLAAHGIVKAGFGLGNDRSQLMRTLGGPLHSLLDLDGVLRQRGFRRSVGVKTAVALLLGRRLAKSKKTGTSDWSRPQLTAAQLRYAANDGYAALVVYRALHATAVRHRSDIPPYI
ncbi:3'-5' exonuclease [Xylophilus sp.]|uniref:3'-5' exonuclease n=1 Tax=Xylophilus sp. TaxID=2653893 RepID=UPI0013BD21AD|nr:3'-5' exonuclease [Xylophilus sp.]KAF1046026.1 MAG: Ribonuclease D [Xylophilus sp.]